MMKTTLDIVNILFGIINTSPLKTAINGGVYKFQRPDKSTKEDVVINAVSSDAEIIQRGVYNINIHVPSVTQTIDGVQQKLPNTARMDALCDIANPILLAHWDGERKFNYWIEFQGVYENDTDKDWYCNFRIIFKQHNTI